MQYIRLRVHAAIVASNLYFQRLLPADYFPILELVLIYVLERIFAVTYYVPYHDARPCWQCRSAILYSRPICDQRRRIS